MTIQTYLQDTYLFTSQGQIINTGQDEGGNFFVLESTIFYPQGGGQPADQGRVRGDDFTADVIKVRQIEGEIRHYSQSIVTSSINAKVALFVDQERRVLNSKYHTAAHLLGNIVEMLYPSLKAIKGHSFPGESYVEFTGNEMEVEQEHIEEKINQAIICNDKTNVFEIDPKSFEQKFYKLPYAIPENKKFRAIQIGSMPQYHAAARTFLQLGR